MAEMPQSPLKAQESMTTREEINFDGDNEHDQETGTVTASGQEHALPNPPAAIPSPKPRVSFQDGHEEIPPQKPPRPLSPQQYAENTLIEAFPSIDAKVVKAVLVASGGKVEPAFNALLSMTDPESQVQEEDRFPPPQPPRPQRQHMSQMEADEMYARQLAEQYNSAPSQHRYNQRVPGRRGPNQQRPRLDDEDREHSFFDDDLPEIGRNIQQGFMETQKKVNNWINNFRKKLDGDEDDEDLYSASRQNTNKWQGRHNFGPGQSDQLHGIRKSAEAQRRSTEAQRYDADPHELGDDEFERLELRDDEVPPPQPPRTSSRVKANPDLFKSQPKPPQSGPVDEVDAAERANSGADAGKAKKWQPLTAVAPHPEEDNDPFSLGDDDEDGKEKGEDLRKEDSERLKEKARNSGSAGGSREAGNGLQESERSGSMSVRNKEAEELLSGKKE